MALTRRVLVIGLTGATIVTGLAVTAGIADAGGAPGHSPTKKPHVATHPHAVKPHTSTVHLKTFAAKRAGVPLRSMAGTGQGSRVVGTLGKAGTPVTVNCYTVGQSMSHDRIWYRTTSPAGAYISGSDVRSGHDPAAGLNRC